MVMKTFNVGDVLAAADVNEYLVNSRYSQKGSDTSRASNTTLTTDPDLAATVDANKIYEMHMVVNYYNGGGSSGNIKTALSLPAGATFYGGVWGNPTGGGSFAALSYDAAGTGAPATGPGTWGASIPDFPLLWLGVVAVGGTGGAVALTWAQNSTSATATIVRQGSFMVLRRVG